MNILCNCKKEIFRVNFNVFSSKNKKQCNKCSKLNKQSRAYTYEYVKNFIEVKSNSGCKLLSTEYINMNKLLLLQCKCGNNDFKVSFSKFKLSEKRKCNECMGLKRWDRESIKTYVEITSDSKCEFIDSKKNKNDHTLFLKCRCGNKFSKSFQNFKKGQIICNECSMKLKLLKVTKTQEQFEKEVFDAVGKEYTVVGEYINSNELIKIRHNSLACNNYTWDVIPSNFLSRESRCPKCQHGSYKKTTEEFKQEVYNLVRSEYEVISEYCGKDLNIRFLHKLCNDSFEMSPHNFLAGQRCTVCGESKGERVIRYFCDYYDVFYESQYSFKDCKNINLLRFDFAIFWDKDKTKLRILIEYDGEFHYLPILGEEQLLYQQSMDKIKNAYCENNNIKLVRIPYWDFDNIESILSKELEVINNGE